MLFSSRTPRLSFIHSQNPRPKRKARQRQKTINPHKLQQKETHKHKNTRPPTHQIQNRVRKIKGILLYTHDTAVLRRSSSFFSPLTVLGNKLSSSPPPPINSHSLCDCWLPNPPPTLSRVLRKTPAPPSPAEGGMHTYIHRRGHHDGGGEGGGVVHRESHPTCVCTTRQDNHEPRAPKKGTAVHIPTRRETYWYLTS